MLIEGRALPDGSAGGARSTGDGIVLVEPVVTATADAAIVPGSRSPCSPACSPVARRGAAGPAAGPADPQRGDRREPAVRRRPVGAAATGTAGRGRGSRARAQRLAAALTVSEGRQRDFLLSISHELRTPLTSLKGYAEALADGVVGPDGAQRAGQTMLAEAGNLERLVTDLLSLARLEAADFPVESVPVELIQLVERRRRRLGRRGAPPPGSCCAPRCPPVPVIVYTDPGPDPAGDRRPAGERAAGGAGRRADRARGARPESGGARVRHSSRSATAGPGFTDADLAVVFERGALYERYRGIRKVGSGLGLALAAGLVRRLGGGIEAGHAPEGGARFTVAMPTLASTRARR